MNRETRGRKIKVQKLINLPRYYSFLLKSISRQKKFLKKELEPQLDVFRNINDGSLTPEDFKKITRYYALGVPGILGEGFAILRGKPLEINERYALTYLGGISGLLDDLFDDPTKDAASLKSWITSPDNVTIENTNSYTSLLLQLYNQGLLQSKYPEQLKLQAIQVYEAQENSLQQQETNSIDTLKKITWQKGGSSFIFYRLCLNNPLEEPEKKLVEHLGGLMQFGNDIFDIYEDYHAGIKTVASVTTKVHVLREIFVLEWEKTNILAYQTHYKKSHIKIFLNLSYLALSRVFVCLDQFEKLQNSANEKFQIELYSRKQLICDMQTKANQVKAIQYFLRSKTIQD